MNMKKCFEVIKSYNILTLIKAGLLEIHRKLWREFVRGSYAQNYEDLIISKLLPQKRNGVYFEIGGYHPTRLSNTYYFYKRGWRGTVIEPNPDIKEMFNKTRPEDKFINAGVGVKKQKLKYYKFLIPALNTFSKTEADNDIKNGHRIDRVETVNVIPIGDAVAKKPIDFLTIDAEGFDKIILKAWPWQRSKPKIICVESDVKPLLTKKGYKMVFKSKYNSIFLFEK